MLSDHDKAYFIYLELLKAGFKGSLTTGDMRWSADKAVEASEIFKEAYNKRNEDFPVERESDQGLVTETEDLPY